VCVFVCVCVRTSVADAGSELLRLSRLYALPVQYTPLSSFFFLFEYYFSSSLCVEESAPLGSPKVRGPSVHLPDSRPSIHVTERGGLSFCCCCFFLDALLIVRVFLSFRGLFSRFKTASHLAWVFSSGFIFSLFLSSLAYYFLPL
jgi:hypothetical protein